MNVDDELCLCFHVSWRKVINYIRIHQIKLPSQLAECQSAGTGCGWCRKAMRQLVDKVSESPPNADELQRFLDEAYPSPSLYADGRRAHIDSGKGRPPRGE
jgi:bacterioferritin-associated ferredoxin